MSLEGMTETECKKVFSKFKEDFIAIGAGLIFGLPFTTALTLVAYEAADHSGVGLYGTLTALLAGTIYENARRAGQEFKCLMDDKMYEPVRARIERHEQLDKETNEFFEDYSQ